MLDLLAGSAPLASDHVPGFGLLAGDSELTGASNATGSAEALPTRASSGVSTSVALAILAMAMSCGLLARRWAMRARSPEFVSNG